jgi:16S rRNA (adenine1518-N6/adenine1519-N6)-dimethyltransferase
VNLLSEIMIESLLKKYGIKPSKKRGQSFLKSQIIAQEIVSTANITKNDSILEIGGGLGILTEAIASKAGQVHVIEIDTRLARALHDLLKDYDNVSERIRRTIVCRFRYTRLLPINH